jgi:hypothetical protein
MLGFLIDDEEFQVTPAISRLFVMNEFMETQSAARKKVINKKIDVIVASFTADGVQTTFGVGETMGCLFYVAINGLIQERDIQYYHVSLTSKITFIEPPVEGSIITISYCKGRTTTFVDTYGRQINVANEYFVYDGSSLTFTTSNEIIGIVNLDINGLVEEEDIGYSVNGVNNVTLNLTPYIGSKIGVTYLY